MITLRKHKHCVICDKPLPKNFRPEDPDGGMGWAFSKLMNHPSIDGNRYEYCQECWRRIYNNQINKMIEVERKRQREVLRDAYLQGYDHRPDRVNAMIWAPTPVPPYECPLCGNFLDEDNICPQCNREYEP